MSLYDGLGLNSEKDQQDKTELAGWSSGIKLLQSQLQLKKAALTQVKKDFKRGSVLPPVVDLKSKKDDPEDYRENQSPNNAPNSGKAFINVDPDWNVRDEYDPLWPNDYEKIIKERREKKEKERDEDRRREYEERRRRNYQREEARERRKREMEEEEERPRKSTGGAAIAPPPSLIEDTAKREREMPMPTNFTGVNFGPGLGSSVAAKIMAKYGFKEGQGLGKSEQGMSQALQVEKTSKRGGKIIHEKDIPKEPFTPPHSSSQSLNPSFDQSSPPGGDNITEVMRNPSKVVLLKNMVGPGEVDEDLEPEVKEECTKYGDVLRCLIFEIPNSPEEEAVRIFVEFKRIESAIKAVVDLNGRYFGGRIVKAAFYNLDKFHRLDLGE